LRRFACDYTVSRMHYVCRLFIVGIRCTEERYYKRRNIC